MDDGAIKALTQYDWPGNIRELVNVIESCYVYADLEWISERHLNLRKSPRRKDETHDKPESTDKFQALDEMEKTHIENALLIR